MRRVGGLILAGVLMGAGACSFLLPEGMIMEGPILNSLFGTGIDAPAAEIVDERIKAPTGFHVEVWADELPGVRVLRFSPMGSLLVSQPRAGRITHVLGDADGDGRSDGQRVLVDDLDRPYGMDFLRGHLYIGEGSAIARISITESGMDSIAATGEPVRIVNDLPAGKNHWTRTLMFGPDGGLYLSIGSSCNVCEEEDPRRAAMLRYESDGSGERIFASGLRNSVGFDWRPGTNELFATDNGRDLLGDDFPPCELNRIVDGGFYGWPYANGQNEADPDFGPGQEDRIAASIPPVHGFRAHNAPLGMVFVRDDDAPAELRGAALVALHGSWNRSSLDGYKVVSLHWDQENRISEREFLTGFQIGNDVIGRPVDVAEGPDGAIFVSDDYAGVIYRVSRVAAQPPGSPGNSSTNRPSTLRGASADPLSALSSAELETQTDRGETLFAEHACASCHVPGQTASGVVVKPLADLRSRFSIEALSAFFLTPQPPMPAYALPEDDRRALAVLLLHHDSHPPSP